MAFSSLPRSLQKDLPPELASWLKIWLTHAELKKEVPDEVAVAQFELHADLIEHKSFFHTAQHSASALHCVHGSFELIPEQELDELVKKSDLSLLKGARSFIVITPKQSVAHQLQQILQSGGEAQLCSTQTCLGPAQKALVVGLAQSPEDSEETFILKMSSAGGGRFDFHLVQPKNKCSLSMLVSLLENFGLQVRKNYFYEIPERPLWELNSFELEALAPAQAVPGRPSEKELAEIIEEAIEMILAKTVDNDQLYKLIVASGLNWRQVQLLRSWIRYLWQIKCPISFAYAADILLQHPALAQKIVEFFEWRFAPERDKEQDAEESLARQEKLLLLLDEVSSSESDLLLRKLIELVASMVRTNYYQRKPGGKRKEWLSFKIDPQKMSEIPEPVMAHEVFVYSYLGEGIHLRSSDIARGGLRWSDRLEDYRTEVLGLAKAQQTKNSIIVPTGAKGAFVVRHMPAEPEKAQEAGVAFYETFIRGLLDITDNRVQGKIVPPPKTHCWDEPDPYLVVAADKGTATFSDRANAISAEYDFWLGDAFASGGSQGYDHKKLGITARGAFVSARHHLRNAQIDPTKTAVRAVGIGDMSGDVFGNGALLIPQLQWVAAFNHRHIFLDPTPHPKAHQERQRLFDKGRGSWDEYDPKLISPGGGVFPRTQKKIPLSPEVQKMLGTTQSHMPPNALISQILQMKVAMIFNGGIGTYVKAATETDLDVGDRQNDACRVNAEQLRCQIFIEGGNLGVTQQGRIAFARFDGGRINTDTLDNSAGVDCSDHEVNIKILLQLAIEKRILKPKDRPALLESLSQAICEKVLVHNRDQNEIVSRLEHAAEGDLLLHSKIISDLCQRGKLNRALEFLPSQKEIEQRFVSRQGLTRPELIILLAFIKIDLTDRLSNLDLDKIPLKNSYLFDYFPKELVKKFGDILPEHPLADKIIIATLVNRFVDELGLSFFYRIAKETRAHTEEIFCAYSWVRDIIAFPQRMQAIRDLPQEVRPEQRYHLMIQLERLMYRSVRWVLKNVAPSDMKEKQSKRVKKLLESYEAFLCTTDLESLKQSAECPEVIAELSDLVPVEGWSKLCFFTRLSPVFALERIAPAQEKKWPMLFERYELTALTLKMPQISAQVNAIAVATEWEALARSQLREQLEGYQVLITEKFGKNVSWIVEHQRFLQFWNQRVEEYFSLPVRDFVQSFVLINQLELLLREAVTD